MSKRDFFGGEPSRFDEGFEPEDVQGLPEIFRPRHARTEYRASLWQFVLGLLIAVTATVLVFVGFLSFAKDESNVIPTLEGAEEWRRAFASKDVYENVLCCSVKLRGACEGESCEWSGVIISEDGWIATSVSGVERAKRGRIYVVLSDGREYGVESFFKLGDTAALKIGAKGLLAAAASELELHAGETVVSVSGGSDILCGSVCSKDAREVDISLTIEGEGATVFDGNGGLIGVANPSLNGGPWNCSGSDIDSILMKIKK
jgi:hypothetical protein